MKQIHNCAHQPQPITLPLTCGCDEGVTLTEVLVYSYTAYEHSLQGEFTAKLAAIISLTSKLFQTRAAFL